MLVWGLQGWLVLKRVGPHNLRVEGSLHSPPLCPGALAVLGDPQAQPCCSLAAAGATSGSCALPACERNLPGLACKGRLVAGSGFTRHSTTARGRGALCLLFPACRNRYLCLWSLSSVFFLLLLNSSLPISPWPLPLPFLQLHHFSTLHRLAQEKEGTTSNKGM